MGVLGLVGKLDIAGRWMDSGMWEDMTWVDFLDAYDLGMHTASHIRLHAYVPTNTAQRIRSHAYGSSGCQLLWTRLSWTRVSWISDNPELWILDPWPSAGLFSSDASCTLAAMRLRLS
jgi:hypothetical protein